MDKICRLCGIPQEATTENFYRNPNSNDGLDNRCKTCHKEQIHEARANNIQHYKGYEKARNRTPRRRKWYKLRTLRRKARQIERELGL